MQLSYVIFPAQESVMTLVRRHYVNKGRVDRYPYLFELFEDDDVSKNQI